MIRLKALRRRWLLAATSVLLLVLMLAPAACGGGAGPASPGGQPEAGKSEITATEAVSPTVMTAGGPVKNPDTYVSVSLSDFITSLDPSNVYDTGSGTIVFNVYETLIFPDGEHPDQFVPRLSTKVPSVENGLIKDDGKTYVFPIQTGVKFQAGPVNDGSGNPVAGSGELTPDDIAYSFHRGMLQDSAGGPQWLVLEPLLGVSAIQDLATQMETASGGKKADAIKSLDDISAENLKKTCEAVKAAVTVDGQNVVFHLKQPFSPFLQVLVGTWGSAMDKEWVAAEIKDDKGAVTKKAGWDGSCDTWKKFHDPKTEDSELFKTTNGTGPFILTEWRREEQITLTRNDAYWRERPAHLKQVIFKFAPEWSTRLLQLQAGDADDITIPRTNQDQVKPLVDQGVLVELKNIPTSSMGFFVLNEKVPTENNTYIGSGKLDGQGVPPDFFGDLHVRKGFSYAFDWDTFIRDGLDGDAFQAKGPIPSSVFGFNKDQAVYKLDLDKAAEEFKQAFGGKLWETGFKLVTPNVSGATNMKTAHDLFTQNLSQINPKFVIVEQDVQPTQLSEDEDAIKVPMEYSAWQEDYHDPHNWVYPILGSKGYFGRKMKFAADTQKQLDDLIEQGRSELDKAKRAETYAKIQQISYDQALIIPRVEPLGHEFNRAWIKGIVNNPVFPGQYYWYLSKEN